MHTPGKNQPMTESLRRPGLIGPPQTPSPNTTYFLPELQAKVAEVIFPAVHQSFAKVPAHRQRTFSPILVPVKGAQANSPRAV